MRLRVPLVPRYRRLRAADLRAVLAGLQRPSDPLRVRRVGRGDPLRVRLLCDPL